MPFESQMFSRTGRDVKPEPVNGRSFVNTVSKLIHRARPQHQPGSWKETERVNWVTFESCDVTDPYFKSLLTQICGSELPIIVILGLANGFQIWASLFSGDSIELLSVRDQPVSCVKLLPSCKAFHNGADFDAFRESRPLMAICPCIRSECQLSIIQIVSLKSGRTVHTLKYSGDVGQIYANSEYIVISCIAMISILHAGTFEELFSITEHSLANTLCKNSVALGTNWLAYPEKTLQRSYQSYGGVSLATPLSASRIVDVAKTVTKTVSDISKTVTGNVTGSKSVSRRIVNAVERQIDEMGVVTIIDLERLATSRSARWRTLSQDSAGERQGFVFTGIHSSDVEFPGVVAHFTAHLDELVTCMEFGPNGTLLLTSGESGRDFHLFNVLPHPRHSSLSAVQHLYTLFRGSTAAAVQDIAFSEDARWTAVTTVNGTTHLFPITPYGGPTNYRTHGNTKVVNKDSRFYRSSGFAGLEKSTDKPDRQSTYICSRGGYPVLKTFHQSYDGKSPPLRRVLQNPRLPPYPTPTLVSAVAKLKDHEFGFISQEGGFSSTEVVKRYKHISGSSRQGGFTKAALFAPVRGARALADNLLPKATLTVALYTISTDGKLTEHAICLKEIAKPKSMLELPVEVNLESVAQWSLLRCKANSCVQPPLETSHLLIIATDTILGTNQNILPEKKEKSIEEEGKKVENKERGCKKEENKVEKEEHKGEEESKEIEETVEDEEYEEEEEYEYDGDDYGYDYDYDCEGKVEKEEENGDADESIVTQEEQQEFHQNSSQNNDCSIAEIETITYAGPHRRLWMGPQFTFKTFVDPFQSASLELPLSYVQNSDRSQPMPVPNRQFVNAVPVVVEASSAGSFDLTPELSVEVCGSWSDNDYITCSEKEGRLRRCIAMAMEENMDSSSSNSDGMPTGQSRTIYAKSSQAHLTESSNVTHDELLPAQELLIDMDDLILANEDSSDESNPVGQQRSTAHLPSSTSENC
ncbi:Breast carcinoma-amplified sequence 3 -like protein [Trichinella pseudospiralis]|uniref:Breast carcinoma-amplified sequence 3-like protein n=1 Tax=Trichinella pseudospiralis TaxID=6337 RepID=A0A0V1K2S0_TRIPS|nr:Breast carcinoma-amplified sequence 3 -like protein [Trichinella pseudospiralis]KRZ41398.1 Breast carcinoma-amplified sequence 3 -like protein [Trichinella pseudospiralis]